MVFLPVLLSASALLLTHFYLKLRYRRFKQFADSHVELSVESQVNTPANPATVLSAINGVSRTAHS